MIFGLCSSACRKFKFFSHFSIRKPYTFRFADYKAAAMAKFFISKKYSGKISDFSVYTEAGGTKATARFKLDNISWAQHFVIEVVMDLLSGMIESREYRHSDDLSFYRNPDLQ